MAALFLFLLFVLVALGTGILAGFSDFKGLKIPNIYPAIIIVSFLGCYSAVYMLSDVQVFSPLISHLYGAALVLAITFVLFSIKAIGAGDSKLATAYALWVGLNGILSYLFLVTLVGGALGVMALLIRKYKPFKKPADGGWIQQLQKGENKVPYGIAIAMGAFAMFIRLGYLHFDNVVIVAGG